MNLISCGCCGTVLDKARIPEEYIWMQDSDLDETVNTKIAAWNRNEKNYEFTINCPACKNRIFTAMGTKFTKSYLQLNNY